MTRSLRPPYLLALAAALLTVGTLGLPGAARGQEGSTGAAVAGGVAAGVGALWSFHALSGCPVVTVGAAREADACDAGSVASSLLGLGAGAWAGVEDRGAGYGVALGAAAGFAASLLLDRVADPPRWLDGVLVVAGLVVGGVLGGEG